MKLILSPKILLLTCLLFVLPNLAAQNNPLLTNDVEAQNRWVDSVYNSLNLKEKVGQLLMISVSSESGKTYTEQAKKQIAEENIGGVIFSKGGPLRQAKLTNEFQEISKTPLLIGMDAEWGLAMRLDSTFALPWNMTLGAIQDNKLIANAGAAISRNTKRLGVHINFAPVVDINTNPENPIIGNRSFGENKINVAEKSLAFMRGMHREGVLSSAKHFPGHGDTDADSHKTLPTIPFSKERLEDLELYPYYPLITHGLSSVMVAHLNVPALQENRNTPTSLSKAVITDLLKSKMNFKGLVFTDALNMKGLTNNTEPGDAELRAFLAGNDMLLMPEKVEVASEVLVNAFKNEIISPSRLAHSVKKILQAKYKAGLQQQKAVQENFLSEELNTVRDQVLLEELFENALTLIKNNKGVLPIEDLDDKRIAYVNFGDADGGPFLKELRKYAAVDWITAARINDLQDKLADYDLVILGYHKSNSSPWASYKFSPAELHWIHQIAQKNKSILSLFSSPYALSDLRGLNELEGILVNYQNHTVAQKKAAQLIFGAIEAKGKLPVSIGTNFPEGTGYQTNSLERLSYGLPESVGLNSYKLNRIDSIITEAIDEKMTPGAQILVARKGKIVYNKNFGYHTYDKQIPVSDTSIYDLASLTKILVTLPLIMEQEEEGIVSFDTKLGEMMPVFQNSNKANIRLQDMLMHYARLKSWIPFHINTIDRKTRLPSKEYFHKTPSAEFNTKVANEMYLRNDMQDTILNIIKDSELERKLDYKYSDLPFYILKYYLEGYYNQTLHNLTQKKIYKPLGATHTGYLPTSRFPLEQIVPTEIDKLWRRQLIHGVVHDQGAALQGGIGGHAGLFSNANDVAKIMHIFLNKGVYGGKRYLEAETISKFNTCYYCEQDVRRGVGFDKPQLGTSGPTCNCLSMESFGHSGFTGTFAWADPEEEIVYVFLSNRTFPDSTNRKLIREDVRSRIQEVIYEAIDF
ncbi:glycoside hydrolase family 3 N-terminal domain-containing protein [Salegentibacter salarius]|uniref:beta-N-acetylhexosaminidase n=1 Tax=Salegentibacter salarius TaxID=435906 RepID=A0A2N0TTX1_9FLAO|nr:glycoside hydrolase family 3 N-terminal domain-containing protein [Salegentibacter salarius]OEY72460.1 beta-N-acetylglucosaminidase [Salegentibacter salarius]PKD18166.1 beta-N-acetylglucosaminidase [Salegentibacter salarius]SLK03005.1 beta-glucosidase [Salegentibacter salarius]